MKQIEYVEESGFLCYLLDQDLWCVYVHCIWLAIIQIYFNLQEKHLITKLDAQLSANEVSEKVIIIIYLLFLSFRKYIFWVEFSETLKPKF